MDEDKSEFFGSLALPKDPDIQRTLLFRMALRSTPALMRPLSQAHRPNDREMVALRLFRLLLAAHQWAKVERNRGNLIDSIIDFSQESRLSEREFDFRFGPITALLRFLSTNTDFASVYYEALSRITSYLSGATRHDHSNDPNVPIDHQPAFDILGFLPQTELTTESASFPSLPLWEPPPHGLVWRSRELWESLGATDQFDFWRRWYDGFVVGEPIDERVLAEVASIGDGVWDQGPRGVSEEIARIESRFELEARIAELEAENTAQITNRHGVGGNMPPEPIGEVFARDTAEVVERIIVVREAVDTLNEEAGKPAPDPSRFKAAMSVIGAALEAILRWTAGKADLSVDTLIRWGVPTGCGYLLLNPDKLQAVYEAARAFAQAWF